MKITSGKKFNRNSGKLPKIFQKKEGKFVGPKFLKILNDPDITLSMADDKGVQKIFYKQREVGWVNPKTSTGYIEPDYTSLVPKSQYNSTRNDISTLPELVKASRSITSAAEITSKTALRRALKNTIDEDLCQELVEYGYSQDGEFADDVFDESEVFFGDIIGETDSEEVARMFFYGEDLDTKSDHANPNRDYFRFDDAGNVESTDYPEDRYYETLLDSVVNYVLDHTEYTDFPDDIQQLVDEYIENTSDEDEDDEE